jgi:hypothetical protein
MSRKRRTPLQVGAIALTVILVAGIQLWKPPLAYHAVRFITLLPFLLVGLSLAISVAGVVSELARSGKEEPRGDRLLAAIHSKRE